MEPSTGKQKKWFAGKQSHWDQFWRRLGYDGCPNLEGKRLLDVGPGLGGNTVAAARAGADVVSLEHDLEILAAARSLVSNDLDNAADKVTFVHGSIEDFSDSGGFDYILCDEVFEHLLDFPAALSAMSGLLRPDGKLVSGWGPLWHSPLGGHQLMLYAVPAGPFGLARILTLKSLSAGRSGRKIIPFSHRLFTRRALRLNGASAQGTGLATIQKAGMNGYTAREFKDMVEKSPLHILRWRENQGDHSAYRVLRVLSNLPGSRNLFTSNIYGVFALSCSTVEIPG